MILAWHSNYLKPNCHLFFEDKLGQMTLAYQCPLQSCHEQFEDRLNLIYHLDSRHPQYGSACANQVQPTFSFSGHIPASMYPRSATASRNATFYFHATPHLRFARRMEVGGACRQRARQPYKLITLEMAILKALLVSRLNVNPDLLTHLSDVVYKKAMQIPTKEVAVKRLNMCIEKLRPVSLTPGGDGSVMFPFFNTICN